MVILYYRSINYRAIDYIAGSHQLSQSYVFAMRSGVLQIKPYFTIMLSKRLQKVDIKRHQKIVEIVIWTF